jgi:hypothetical protein
MEIPESYKKNAITRARIPYWLVIKRYWVNWLGVALTWYVCVSLASLLPLSPIQVYLRLYHVRPLYINLFKLFLTFVFPDIP